MKNTLLLFLLLTSLHNYAQNVGIGNSSPAEKLDVTGNINVTGTIKANGTDGSPNQVLMKNASGDLAWGDMCEYKNFVTFFNTTTYNIPPGVTKIMVELWGAGGGGNEFCGGGGGGYVRAQFTVSPGDLCTINIGFGGSGVANASAGDGGECFFNVAGTSFYATGGKGAKFTTATSYVPGLGGASVSSSTPQSYFIIPGKTGGALTKRYEQSNATTFLEIVEGGQGGSPHNFPNNGGDAPQRIYNLTTATTVIYTSGSRDGKTPGGGGSGGITSPGGVVPGGFGAKGLVIIHY